MNGLKAFFPLVIFLFVGNWSWSQGQYFNYQGVARNDQGQPLADQQIRLRFRLNQLSDDGQLEQVMEETYVRQTDTYGFFQVELGLNSGPDFLSGLSWGEGSFELAVEMDPQGGTNYEDFGTHRLLPVPLAMHALTVADVEDADADPENEIQYLNYDFETQSLNLTTERQDDFAIDAGIYFPRPIFIRKGNTILADDFNPSKFVFGSDQMDYVEGAGSGNRFFFNAEKAAFRAGTTYDDTTDVNLSSIINVREVWNENELGPYSFAGGKFTYAPEAGGTAFGELNFALARHSTAIGYGNIVMGRGGVVLGLGNASSTLGQTTVGMYSRFNSMSNQTEWVEHDPVFVVGNGTSFENRSTAFLIKKNGRSKFYGPLTVYSSPYLSNQEDGFRMELSYNGLEIVSETGSQAKLIPGRLSIGTFENNTLVGINTALTLVEGFDNAVFGFTAGEGLRTGSENTLLGSKAGRGVFAGDGNTMVGYAAGNPAGSGSRNVYLGSETGLANTGDGNVFIGYRAGSNERDVNNRLYIDNKGLDAENALIYGEFDDRVLRINNSLGIGTRPSFGLNLEVKGDAGVGAASDANGPSEFLAVYGKEGAWFLNTVNANSRGESDFYLSPSGSFPDGVFHVKPNGDIGIGTTNPLSDLHVVHGDEAGVDGLRIEHSGSNNNYWTYWVSNNTGRLFVFTKAAGNGPDDYVGVYNNETGEYFARSDSREKKDIVPMPEVLRKLNDIPLYQYRYQHQSSDHSPTILGVMAQDLVPHFPELVMHDEEHDTYLVNYKGLSMVALQAVKEQDKKIDDLEKRLADLEVLVRELAEKK